MRDLFETASSRASSKDEAGSGDRRDGDGEFCYHARMPAPAFRIRPLAPEEIEARAGALAGILIDCVEGGASVSFLAPLSRAKAEAFWRRIAASARAGERALLIAEDESGAALGTVQILLAQPENQAHRADIQKLLVVRRARGAGLGAALMEAVEEFARARGKTLLMLDTTAGMDGERLYLRTGWTRFGAVPGHALMPDGRPSDTAFFYKRIG